MTTNPNIPEFKVDTTNSKHNNRLSFLRIVKSCKNQSITLLETPFWPLSTTKREEKTTTCSNWTNTKYNESTLLINEISINSMISNQGIWIESQDGIHIKLLHNLYIQPNENRMFVVFNFFIFHQTFQHTQWATTIWGETEKNNTRVVRVHR